MALHPDTLVAYAMNGEPLPRRHGYPARLVVPGWYGVASVKWLTTVTALDRPFTGYFQTRRYIVPSDDGSAPRPLTRVAPRSLIVAPEDGSTVRPGRRGVRGLAWSGHGPVELVEVSTDGGQSWRPAQWTGTLEPHAWRIWEFPWDAEPGEYVLQSRATDAAGNTQPVTAEWNRLGYANNAIHSVRVTCAGDPLDL
jgi:DMSO/TMAO reductase YedYZ molybdopterin-dependent catalytic subunit